MSFRGPVNAWNGPPVWASAETYYHLFDTSELPMLRYCTQHRGRKYLIVHWAKLNV